MKFFLFQLVEIMSLVAIKVKSSNKFLTVPDCEDTKIELCDSICDNDPSQVWIFENSTIKWAERPYMYLGMEEENDHKLQLKRIENDFCSWIFHDSKLILRQHPSIILRQNNNIIFGSSEEGKTEDFLEWEMIPSTLPQPATSCHLRYGPELPDWINSATEWKLECTVKVEKSTSCTYFMVCGFNAGYCGIQDLPGGERKAIFSIWNSGPINVELVEANPKAEVSKFGGEGTGIKTMMAFPWREGDFITFQVEAYKSQSDWICSCQFSCNNESTFMAMLKRNIDGGKFLNRTGFYSFVEDWDRCPCAKGYKKLRKAEFLNPKLNDSILTKALFTKVETGSDGFAADFAKGWKCHNGFGLQTGIDDICPNHTILE